MLTNERIEKLLSDDILRRLEVLEHQAAQAKQLHSQYSKACEALTVEYDNIVECINAYEEANPPVADPVAVIPGGQVSHKQLVEMGTEHLRQAWLTNAKDRIGACQAHIKRKANLSSIDINDFKTRHTYSDEVLHS